MAGFAGTKAQQPTYITTSDNINLLKFTNRCADMFRRVFTVHLEKLTQTEELNMQVRARKRGDT